MASRGGFDIGTILQNAFHLFKSKLSPVCAGPCDGLILKMHYRWAFYFSIGGFLTVWYGWYFGKVIHCVSSFKGDQEARTDYQNICLSYPYVRDDNGDKRFLLFYRWVHWSFLLLAIIFYIPRKVSKSIENTKAKKLLEDLATLSPRYDQSEKEMIQRAAHYMTVNMKTHNGLYIQYVVVNVLALLIDIFVLRFLDFIFHNRFLLLVPNSYPFNRDPVNFKDYISQTFPPFASCVLNDAHKILDGRTETIGCHLTNMELYEKLFIIFWFVLYALIVITAVHIIYLLLMIAPALHRHFLRTSKPFQGSQSVELILSKLLRIIKFGDVYMLWRIKQQMKHARFYELILRLSDIATHSIQSTVPTEHKPTQNHINNPNQYVPQQTIRNRQNEKEPHPDLTAYQTQLKSIPLLQQTQLSQNLGIYPDLSKQKEFKNTSILIE